MLTLAFECSNLQLAIAILRDQKLIDQEISLFLAKQNTQPPFEVSEIISLRSPAKIVL
jgi:hypothetical protein